MSLAAMNDLLVCRYERMEFEMQWWCSTLWFLWWFERGTGYQGIRYLIYQCVRLQNNGHLTQRYTNTCDVYIYRMDQDCLLSSPKRVLSSIRITELLTWGISVLGTDGDELKGNPLMTKDDIPIESADHVSQLSIIIRPLIGHMDDLEKQTPTWVKSTHKSENAHGQHRFSTSYPEGVKHWNNVQIQIKNEPIRPRRPTRSPGLLSK